MVEKSLQEMTLEELWRLFPIVLKGHDPQYKNWYQQQKEQIRSTLSRQDIYRISHIGSTAVEGLTAKPTVDILLEMNRNCDMGQVRQSLEQSGWFFMSGEIQRECRLLFHKGYTPQGFAEKVFHLHVRRAGDWDELYFRDYLMTHPETAYAYAELKKCLCAQYKYNRDAYTQAKGDFIRTVTHKARKEMQGKYALE